jgi:hypothetical protein
VGGAFLVSALVGAYGDAVLRDNDNFWTAWIVPLAAIIFAGSFTEFYPDYATGQSKSWARIFDWLPPFVVVTGIVGWNRVDRRWCHRVGSDAQGLSV